jgi:hypothetical protein
MNCFKCGSDEHLFAACPARAPRRKAAPAPAAPPPAAAGEMEVGKDFDAHLAAIDGYAAMWHRGEITTGEKRRAVSDENLAYYGDKCRPELLWQGGPGDSTRVGSPVAAEVPAALSDAVAQAGMIRDMMGWSAERKAQRLRDEALAQAAESRAARDPSVAARV